MKKSLLFLAFAGILGLNVSAQQSAHCFTDEICRPLIENNPQYKKNIEELEKFTAENTNHQNVQRSGNAIYIIPVVFHVLHNYGTENVSDQLLRDAVALMNADFRKMNADTGVIIPQFKPIMADCEIEFRLATLDPNGNCTNGIEHLQTLKTYGANDFSKEDPSWIVWPNNKYLNIWIAHDLENTGAAAYAHIPGTGTPNTDGVMCLYTYASNLTHTLSHEVGHHFNLYHPWGMTNAPRVDCLHTDYVGDTPTTKGWDFCPSLTQAAECDPNVIENFQNFMDYSYCDAMFTEGQKTRMHLCLNNGTSGRNNLWISTNLIATGTNSTAPQVCTPVADFKSESYAVCVNTPLQFTDQSWKADVTSWNWSFPGGSPSTSTDQNPSVTYANAGTFDVTLIAGTSAGTDTITKVATVHVSDPPSINAPYVEDFEGATPFPGIDGWLENYDGPINWQLVTNASAGTGSKSIKINNYANTAGYTNSWITPSVNFTGITMPKLNFKVAYAQKNVNSNDGLQVWYSTNCGRTWANTSYNKSGVTLGTNGGTYVSTSFSPTSASQWRQEQITVNPIANKSNVRFKFVNLSDRGNNIYVDEINFTGNGVGIDENDGLQTGLSVYPNPSNGTANVSFNLSNAGKVSLDVKNIIGQNIQSVINDKLFESGLHEITLQSLSAGVYMIDLTVNSKHNFVRLVVN